MNINIENFRRLLTKATLNFGIETLQLRLSDRIKCDSLNQNGTSISILDVENDILDTQEELIFNFGDPSQSVMRFINKMDTNIVDISLTDLFMKFHEEGDMHTKIGFVSDAAVKRLGTDDVKSVDWFFETEIDKDIIKKFERIKSMGAIFGKIYVDLKGNNLFIDTSDKTNRYSNGVKFKLAEIDRSDLSLAYTYVDMVNFMHCIEMDIEKTFTMKISYNADQELGCIYASSGDEEEKYALISRYSL